MGEKIVYAVFVIFILIGVSIIAKTAIDQVRDSRTCRDNGYLGSEHIDGHVVCYGYTDGNTLVVVPLDSLKGGE